MKQLAGLDAAFLHLETAEMPMHVGALHVLELPADYDGDYLQDLREHMASRLPLAPALRRRLESMPLNLANPTWVDAEPDLDVHIVGYEMPPGSGVAALEQQVSLLHPQLLDRSLPLWKFHIFLGLEPGPEGQQYVGLYSQLHHAAVDGKAAVALAEVILDLSAHPHGRKLPAVRTRRVQLGAAGMLRGAIAHQWQQTLSLAKALPGAAGTLSMMAARTALDAAGSSLHDWLSPEPPSAQAKAERVRNVGLAPRTRLNTSLSAERSFSTVSLPLLALNRTRRLHGASLNDALLFICGGALRRLFAKLGPLPPKSLVAAVPVSMRAKGDATANTQATMSLVSLGTHLADPAKRLAHVLAASAAMKSELDQVKDLMPSDYPSIGVPWLMQAGALLYGRLRAADKLPVVANLVISNVPGPTVPLYLAGARVLTNYPASIIVHGMALNITVQTFDASLDIGIMACGQALPETAALAAYIETAFMEFLALPSAQEAAKPKPARKRAAPKR
ncbi:MULTISPECIES: wax ester/triacylglycerol synthase family O-acyltransferase [Roseateles]|uniref:diacylglycerol O-acyltransferase n=1 Tax=Roseateles albus TaxID=2987525 RepID=A0ABT5K9D4_9BURK|nr:MULTISPECIES: wax ester/triacylglycerol synthase family O-acyltransferase [Roseateles]MCV2358696.1 wax ester/triacylglycerol synthase family O-acyltransferase [Paucibacter sp. TC2R-5]MDC8770054.1 wax ester/triacylglycerol synthase family O-acyltransferase [Roseateles albus]